MKVHSYRRQFIILNAAGLEKFLSARISFWSMLLSVAARFSGRKILNRFTLPSI